MKKSYWIGWISETVHHNYGSDCASYTVNDGRLVGFDYKGAMAKFQELIESAEYCELVLFDEEDKIIKSWSMF